jgi:outer membrane lipoprotein-sorting protein
MKRTLAFIFTALILQANAYGQDAAAIMAKARGGETAASMGSQSRISTTRKNGSTETMTVTQYSKDDRAGRSRMTIIINDGPNKNTRLLAMENAQGKTDQWVYTVSTGKVRRLSTSDSSESFAGTGFSYGDMSITDRDVSADTHRFVEQNGAYGSRPAWVIESTPKDKDYEYSRVVSWVAKADNKVYKMEMYDQAGKKSAILEISEYAQDGKGHSTPKSMRMQDLDEGTTTTINILQVQFDMNIPEAVFTTSYLETGRAR